MSTNKFKVGDKIRCVYRASNQYIQVGAVYTVKRVKGNLLVLQEIELPHGYEDSRFELVQDVAVLTPEEVLQYFKENRQDDLECIQPNGLVLDNMTEYTGVKYIFECEWRVKYKPEPEIITLNGKRYQALED